jgi:hypothetical protein
LHDDDDLKRLFDLSGKVAGVDKKLSRSLEQEVSAMLHFTYSIN